MASLSSVYNTGQSEAVILCLVTIKQLNPKDEISKVTALLGRRTWLSTKEHRTLLRVEFQTAESAGSGRPGEKGGLRAESLTGKAEAEKGMVLS